MKTILSILGFFVWAGEKIYAFFSTQSIVKAEDQKIEVATLQKELADVKASDSARDSVRNASPQQLRVNDGYRRD